MVWKRACKCYRVILAELDNVMHTSPNNKCSMLGGSNQLYNNYIGKGNKTLLVDMHKGTCITNPLANYMYCLGLLKQKGLIWKIAHTHTNYI